jgi:hypothetical protein
MSNNVVKLVREKDRDDQKILEFLKDKKCLVIVYDDDTETIKAVSNFDPGLRECTLAHFGYLYLLQEMMALGEYEDDI